MTLTDFISRFEKKTKTINGFIVRCPAHEDGTASLSVAEGKDCAIILKCFAGCKTESVLASLGLTFKDLFKDAPAKLFNVPAPRKPVKPESTEKPVIEKIYSYQDKFGTEHYQAIRLKPKSFRQRHKVGTEWVWNMDGVERALYHLPEVLSAKEVFIVEGEKDADNLTSLGLVATCNVGGAGKWMDGYTEALAGKDVVLCGDNDEPGRKHMGLVFDSIAGTAKTVKIIKVPEILKDVSDYIATFKTPEEAKHAIQNIVDNSYPHVRGTKLPIYAIHELEDPYRRLVRSFDKGSFSLGKWIPSLGKIRALIPGELMVVQGDTGTGKTGILQSIARAALPLPTLMFELELPKEMMFERFISMTHNMTGQAVEDIYRSEYGEKESNAAEIKILLNGLFICPEARLTIEQIENYVVRAELKMGERPKVVLVDYIQLIGGSGENRRDRFSNISEGLKVMANKTQTIVILASQIARQKEEEEPGLHSAKESGSIENSCGILLSVWRDSKDPTLLSIRVLKATKGGAGLLVECNFDGAKMKITERGKIDRSDCPSNAQTNDP